MRKIVAASAIAVALVAGQALAANGAAQTLNAGDRVAAALGEPEGFQSGLGGMFGGMSFMNLFFGIIIPAAILTKIVVDDVNQDDQYESPS